MTDEKQNIIMKLIPPYKSTIKINVKFHPLKRRYANKPSTKELMNNVLIPKCAR